MKPAAWQRAAVAVVGMTLCLSLASVGFGLEPQAPLQGPYAIDHIVDGDTLSVIVEGRRESVRLIGIDTPETKAPGAVVQPFGPEAADFLGRLLVDRPVWLELDAQPRDRYQRLLAYVYFRDPDGSWSWRGERYTQANLRMAFSGFADTLTIPPDVRYAELYQYAVRTARDAQHGMWHTPLGHGVRSTVPGDGVLDTVSGDAVLDAVPGDAAQTARVEGDSIGRPAARVACVLYNPPGRDDGHETVTLQVIEALDSSGWHVADAVGHVLSLPRGRFAPGDTIVVRNFSDPIWNNSGGDTVYLFDASGTRVDTLGYGGGGTESCRR